MDRTAPTGRRTGGQSDTLTESEVVVALFRNLLVLMVMIAPAAVGQRSTSNQFYGVAVGAAVYALIVTLLLHRHIRWRFQRHVVLTVDILLLTLLIHHQGELREELFPLYYVTVIMGAIWFNFTGAVAAAALATGASVLMLVRAETVPEHALYYELQYLMLPHVFLLFLIAILCAYLAEAWRAERLRADEHQRVVSDFAQDINMARELQTLILPATLPSAPGLEIGIRARQARVVVGGDYYDAVALGGGRLAVCCADVSGKSIPGQLRLPLVKYGFRVCARQFVEPGATLGHLAGLLYDELPPEVFVTMLYALFDPAAGTVALARAGHCPPLHLVAASGEVASVCPPAPPLGVVPGFAYPETVIPFQPDDYLVVYTDGVVEAVDRRGRMLEVEGLSRLLGEATPESAQDLANVLFQALEEYEVGEKRDDLTILAVRRSAT